MDRTLYHGTQLVIAGSYKILILTCFLLIFLFPGCRKAQPEIRILFTGDILLSRNVKSEVEQRKISPWLRLDSLFHSADLVIGNFEGAVGDSSDRIQSTSTSPIFDVSKNQIPYLFEAGFKALSVENNHSLDLGENGKQTTIQTLLQSNIIPLTFENSPRFFRIKGVTIAIITINLIPGHDHSCQAIPSVDMKQKLRLASSLANMTIVYIHWGSELLEWPNQFQRIAAKWLVKNGADLIIGSHPHVIQMPEMVDGKPVFFSLGNHLFDQKYLATKKGLIVDCLLRNGKFQCKGILTKTMKNSFYPEIEGSLSLKLRPVLLRKGFYVGNISIQPLSLQNTKQYQLILEAYRKEKRLWQTFPMPIATITTSRLDGKKEFIITLENHYSSIDDAVNLRPYVYSVDRSGLVANWRGSALSWPLIDAVIPKDNLSYLYAMHRGDSFIHLNSTTKTTRFAVYRWNGFGFSGVNDSIICQKCATFFDP